MAIRTCARAAAVRLIRLRLRSAVPGEQAHERRHHGVHERAGEEQPAQQVRSDVAGLVVPVEDPKIYINVKNIIQSSS